MARVRFRPQPIGDFDVGVSLALNLFVEEMADSLRRRGHVYVTEPPGHFGVELWREGRYLVGRDDPEVDPTLQIFARPDDGQSHRSDGTAWLVRRQRPGHGADPANGLWVDKHSAIEELERFLDEMDRLPETAAWQVTLALLIEHLEGVLVDERIADLEAVSSRPALTSAPHSTRWQCCATSSATFASSSAALMAHRCGRRSHRSPR